MQILVLEKKIEQENEQLEEKISSYKLDIEQYSDVHGARSEAEEKRTVLNEERDSLMRTKNKFQQATEAKTRRLQEIQTRLSKNDEYISCVDEERKLKAAAEANYDLKTVE